ncbi:MAG: hypothetical protein U5L96_09790 [Owenweeksia sp.]|nr:hypothetical protein [Owenweeksia sp.]
MHPVPKAGFTMPGASCAGDSFQVVNNSVFRGGNANFSWSASSQAVQFSDPLVANPIVAFPNFNSGMDSTYNLSLVVTSVDGCVDTITKSILIHSRPKADFSFPPSACTPMGFSPFDSSQGRG